MSFIHLLKQLIRKEIVIWTIGQENYLDGKLISVSDDYISVKSRITNKVLYIPIDKLTQIHEVPKTHLKG